MQADDLDDLSDLEPEDELTQLFEASVEAAKERGNARAYEIRRRLEDLEEKRRFASLFEDLE